MRVAHILLEVAPKKMLASSCAYCVISSHCGAPRALPPFEAEKLGHKFQLRSTI